MSVPSLQSCCHLVSFILSLIISVCDCCHRYLSSMHKHIQRNAVFTSLIFPFCNRKSKLFLWSFQAQNFTWFANFDFISFYYYHFGMISLGLRIQLQIIAANFYVYAISNEATTKRLVLLALTEMTLSLEPFVLKSTRDSSVELGVKPHRATQMYKEMLWNLNHKSQAIEMNEKKGFSYKYKKNLNANAIETNALPSRRAPFTLRKRIDFYLKNVLKWVDFFAFAFSKPHTHTLHK